MQETLNERIKNISKHETTPKHLALKWSLEAAIGLAFIHLKDVIQSDVGCYNLLLDCHNNQMFTEDIAADSTTASDIFALGCVLYEIWTTKIPYEKVPRHEVRQNYKEYRFLRVSRCQTACASACASGCPSAYLGQSPANLGPISFIFSPFSGAFYILLRQSILPIQLHSIRFYTDKKSYFSHLSDSYEPGVVFCENNTHF